jgi:hypothetical protein
MKIIPFFKGLNKEIHPRLIGDTQLSDCKNVLFKDGKVRQRWGYTTYGTLPLELGDRVSLITNFNKLRNDTTELIVCTDNDIYVYNAGSWDFLTRNYAVGTASCSGGTAVTGSGTTWVATWPDDVYYIKFGTNDVNGTGTPDTWHSGPNTGGAVNYVIRRCYQTAIDDVWDVAYVIEPSGGNDELWAIFTNGSDLIQRYTGSDECDDLTGPTVYSKYIAAYFDHIVLAWATIVSTGVQLPQSIYWNDRGDPEEWSTGSASFADLLKEDDRITGLEVLKERLYVFKEYSIVEGYWTGLVSPALEFTQNKVVEIGCPNGRTIANAGNFLIFLGRDNVYVFDGFQVTPIGGDIQRYLIQQLNSQYSYKNFAHVIFDENLYCLFVATTTNTTTAPDTVFVYNWEEQSWTIWNMADYMSCHGTLFNLSDIAWNDLVGTWADQAGPWLLRTTTQDAYIHAYGDEDGYVYKMDFTDNQDNGTNIDSFIETKDYSLNDYDKVVRLLSTGITADPNEGNLLISASIDFGSTWSDTISINQDTGSTTEHIQNWIRRGEQFRFRISNSEGSQFGIENLVIKFRDAGMSLAR